MANVPSLNFLNWAFLDVFKIPSTLCKTSDDIFKRIVQIPIKDSGGSIISSSAFLKIKDVSHALCCVAFYMKARHYENAAKLNILKKMRETEHIVKNAAKLNISRKLNVRIKFWT